MPPLLTSSPAPRFRETLVRTYKTTDQYQRDVEVLAGDRWQVAQVSRRPPSSGVGRLVGRTPIALVVRLRPELVVTYTRAVTPPGTRPRHRKQWGVI
jgi:hypothetical protein